MEFVAWWVWTVPMALNEKFNVIRQHIRTLNTLLLKHIRHAHRRTTTLPPIPPSELDWIAPKPVTSYTRIHRVGIRRVELVGYFFGYPEWIHCLAPSTALMEFVAWCVFDCVDGLERVIQNDATTRPYFEDTFIKSWESCVQKNYR